MQFSLEIELLLALSMFLGAVLYTSVGHAGASAYIAMMALFGVPAATMRPTALVLNIIVAGYASSHYIKAGLFRFRTLWPFLLGALPMAILGGYIQIPGQFYRPVMGVVLLIAALRLLWVKNPKSNTEWKDPPIWLAIPAGAAIGFLSGLTGTGGGIFLSPLILFLAWSETRTASGVAAVFILCNSTAGLLGNLASVRALPAELPLYAVAVLLGAVVGTSIGVGKLPQNGVIRALGVVLIIAGFKLIGVY